MHTSKLTNTDLIVNEIYQRPGLSADEINDVMGLPSASITGTLSRLIDQGRVSRERYRDKDKGERRAVFHYFAPAPVKSAQKAATPEIEANWATTESIAKSIRQNQRTIDFGDIVGDPIKKQIPDQAGPVAEGNTLAGIDCLKFKPKKISISINIDYQTGSVKVDLGEA